MNFLSLAAAVLFMAPLALPAQSFDLQGLQRGQRGTCYTVFEGAKVEPFDFEVKGAMKNFLGPNKDVVLVRLLGERTAFTGVAAGMSGSPCLLQGKLLGALAYSFSIFAKEPIAGITPIENMREVWQLGSEARDWRLPADAMASGASTASSALAASLTYGRDGTAAAAWLRPPVAVAAAGLQPLVTPLSMGGVAPAVQQAFAPWLQAQGFAPLAAAGANAGAGVSTGAPGAAAAAVAVGTPALQPGGSVAAIMVSGDVDVAATGTVTEVRGDKVLAFGHPFMSSGAVSLPLAQADILNLMASSMRSFKMSVTGPVVGELTQDRLTAIGGVLGRRAQTVAVSGSVRSGAVVAPISLKVARDPQMTPRLLAMALAASLSGRVEANPRGLLRYRAEIRQPGQPPLVLQNVHAAQRDTGLLGTAAVDVARAFAALWEAPFGAPPQLAVHLEAELSPEPIEEVVESIALASPRVRPGSTVEVAVRLRRRDTGPTSRADLSTTAQGTLRVERFALRVSPAWRGSRLQLRVGGAAAAEQLDLEVGGQPQPRQRAEIADYLRRRRPDGQLYLQVVRQGPGLAAGGQSYAFLPPSMVASLAQSGVQRLGLGLAVEQRRPMPGVVLGRAGTALEVLTQ